MQVVGNILIPSSLKHLTVSIEFPLTQSDDEGFFEYYQESLHRPGRGAEYCDQPICLCVCLSVCLSVRKHISGSAGPIGTKFCVRIPCGRGLVFLQRRCATLMEAQQRIPYVCYGCAYRLIL